MESQRMKKALITGITGQDGAYLAEFLLERATRFMGSSVVRLLSIPSESIICIRILTLRTAVSFYITVI